MTKMLVPLLLLAFALGGCAGQQGPYYNAGHTFRTPYGSPISGAVTVGVNRGGLVIRPSIGVQPVRIDGKGL